jgi:hypothetical protein
MFDAVGSREDITRRVLELLPFNDDSEDQRALKNWWYITSSISTNLRLTDLGDHAFRMADLEYRDLPWTTHAITENFAGILTKLGTLECPFYTGKKNRTEIWIRIYDSRVAVMIVLHGSVENYINSRLRHDK